MNQESIYGMDRLQTSQTRQSTEPQKESQPDQGADRAACALLKRVSLHEKTDGRLLSDVSTETLGTDKKSIFDRLPFPCEIKLSINELKEETICHTTASVLQKNFTKGEYSESSIFSVDDQDKYKTYINSDPKHDYIFVHKLKASACAREEETHDFVIVRKDKDFLILQSMVRVFTLEQWITGDSSTVDKMQQSFKGRNDFLKLHRKNKSVINLTEEFKDDLIKSKRYYKEFKKSKSSFDRIVRTKRNRPCSKGIFNQKILPTLFATLKNSDDRPYLRIFSVSRGYLTIKPEYKVFFEVHKNRLYPDHHSFQK